MRYRELLNELTYYDKWPLTKVLQANKGRWIHFSKIPKLGVNPTKTWKDPYGIYFYPVDWLLSGFERITDGQQFALDNPYYFICDIDLSAPGVELGTVTWPQVEVIATRNGWYNWIEDYRAHPDNYKFAYYMKPDVPGDFLWHFVEILTQHDKIRWNQAFKGLAYIRDNNHSIIHNNEPNQIVVFDPRIIKNVQMGENKKPVKFDNRDKAEAYLHVRKQILATLAKTYGATLTWKNKQPQALKFVKDGVSFSIETSEQYGRPVFTVHYRYKRAKAYRYFNYEFVDKHSADEVIAALTGAVDDIIAKSDNDLYFEPYLSEEEGKKLIAGWYRDPSNVKFETEIDNENDKYSSMTITGTYTSPDDRVSISTKIWVRIDKNGFSPSIYIYVGDRTLTGAYFSDKQTREQLPEMEAAMLDQLAQHIEYELRSRGPSASSWSSQKFYGESTAKAAMGYILLASNLSLGHDAAQRKFEDLIFEYEAQDRAEQNYIVSQVNHVYKRY